MSNCENKIFEFEEDFAGNLRCIPMSTRLKLDLAKVKVSLSQWDNLSIDNKKEIVSSACSEANPAPYKKLAVELIEKTSKETPKELKNLDTNLWKDVSKVSPIVEEECKKLKLPTVSLDQWKALSDLQRFTLIKLADAEHEVNFAPAMKEFGLMK